MTWSVCNYAGFYGNLFSTVTVTVFNWKCHLFVCNSCCLIHECHKNPQNYFLYSNSRGMHSCRQSHYTQQNI